jgi:hypothetical protein
MATDPDPQTILRRRLDDREVVQTICGPISAKMRAMVVINLTCNGLLCLPMYTHSKNNNLSQARYEELVSISQSYTWPGKTPWAGLPLHMTLRGNYASISFIELLQPVHILAESSINDIGFPCDAVTIASRLYISGELNNSCPNSQSGQEASVYARRFTHESNS